MRRVQSEIIASAVSVNAAAPRLNISANFVSNRPLFRAKFWVCGAVGGSALRQQQHTMLEGKRGLWWEARRAERRGADDLQMDSDDRARNMEQDAVVLSMHASPGRGQRGLAQRRRKLGGLPSGIMPEIQRFLRGQHIERRAVPRRVRWGCDGPQDIRREGGRRRDQAICTIQCSVEQQAPTERLAAQRAAEKNYGRTDVSRGQTMSNQMMRNQGTGLHGAQRPSCQTAHRARRGSITTLFMLCVLSWVIEPVLSQANRVVDAPIIATVVANDPDDLDGVYANLDTITITFDKNTDKAGLATDVVQSSTIVDSLFSFNQALGAAYNGRWQDAKVFVITVLDWPGSAPPRVGPEGLIVTPVTSRGRAIRADPFTEGLSMQSTASSGTMTGDFGKELIKIDRITAANPSEEGDEYDVGDTITIDFSEDTNQGFTTLGGVTEVTQAQLDNLFEFSHPLGASYSGKWIDKRQLVITVLDTTGSGPPPIERFTMTVKSSGDLRNDPPACAPSTSTSPILVGEWGACKIEIIEIKAADPTKPPNVDRSFSVNDTISISFNKDTNRANFPDTELTKTQVDSIFEFRQSLGEDYVGRWISRQLFQITSVKPAGAAPSINFFTLSVKASAELRNYPPQSAICEIESGYLTGNWGTIIPKITDFYANGAGGTQGKLDPGDELYIAFDPPTNRFRMQGASVATKSEIDKVLNFSQPIGTDYEGLWISDSLFQVTIRDASESAAYQRGMLRVNCIPTAVAPIRNADGISSGCYTASPNAVRGDFGESSMTLSVIAIGDDKSSVTAGDKILLNFSLPTDQAENGPFSHGLYANKTYVDRLFSFSQKLGIDYEGLWLSRSEFLITILQEDPVNYPFVGTLRASVSSDADMREFPPNSAPIAITSSVLSGDFGPNSIEITSIVAVDPLQASPTYAPGDMIRIFFSQDTNRANLGSDVIDKETLDTVFTFSVSLGNDYEARWTTRKLLEITVKDVSGAGPPLPGLFTLALLPGAGLRNFPVTSASAGMSAPALTGNFGPSPIRIVSMVAADSLDLDNVYGVGDTLTITFNQDTNKAGLPDVLTKTDIDFLLEFTESLGADYTGDWMSPSVLRITAVDVTGAGPPGIGLTRATTRAEAKLRNLPPVCDATVTTSPRISGNWGILYPRIVSLVADDPTDKNSVYSFLDTITITFSIPTNRNGKANGDRLSRSELMQLFLFSENMGNAFSGEWVTASVLVLTVEGTSGASPPSIGSFMLTCRINGGALLRNEIGTSRPCSQPSPVLTGDFGPSNIQISSLFASDPTGLGARYRAGNTISVTFSEDTNLGGYSLGQIMPKTALDNLFTYSTSIGQGYYGEWTSRKVLVITIVNEDGAGPPIPGDFVVSVKATGNLRNYPPGCAPTVVTSGAMTGAFGESSITIDSWVAGAPPGFGDCKGYVTGATMTVTFSETTNRAGQGKQLSRAQVDFLFSFGGIVVGQNYNGEWKDDRTVVITVLDPLGSSPPQVGLVIGQVRKSGNLRPIPPVTEAADPVAPPMIGAFGPPNVEIVNFYARDPDNADSVFSDEDEIGITFNVDTNKANLPDAGITRSQLESVFTFSMNIGTDFVGRWASPKSMLITILNSTQDSQSTLFYPPYVGLNGLTVSVKESGDLRNTPAVCGASVSSSSFLVGDFGPNGLYISSLRASSLAQDPIYGTSDQITITFSEMTNMGGSMVGLTLSASEVEKRFNFSMNLGQAYSGSWLNRKQFAIAISGNDGASPPEIGHLRVTVLEGASIQNFPPQSKIMADVVSPLLEGNFGPSSLTIKGFTAHDPENSANEYHAGVLIAVIISERPTWKKLPVYDGLAISKSEIDEMFEFSHDLGSDYTGRWLVRPPPDGRCPWKIFSATRFVDGPPCFGVVIEILDIDGNEDPQIGELFVRFRESGDVRNSPAQSAPTVAVSSPITGDWGITIPYVSILQAEDGGGDEVYGEDDRIYVTFSEETDRASITSATMDKETLDRLLYFDQSLGSDYTGRWESNSRITITILNATGASPPEIGTLTVKIRKDAGLELRNADSDSFAADKRYTFNSARDEYGITGSFAQVGLVQLSLENLTAVSAEPASDDRWGAGDVITVDFSRVVNKGCYQGCPDFGLTNEYITSMLRFSDSVWTPQTVETGILTGRWLSEGSQPCLSCKSGTSGPCKEDSVLFYDALQKEFLYQNITTRPCAALNGSECPVGYSLCNSRRLQIIGNQADATVRPPTIGGLRIEIKKTGNLRNYPASMELVSGAITQSKILTGNFGPPCVRIQNLIAGDPIGHNGDFTVGDTITIDFNQDTNRAGGPETLNKAELLDLIDFFCNNGEPCQDFANDFEGRWKTRQTLEITVTDVSNTFPHDQSADPMRTPLPGDFYVKIKDGAYLINYPPACLPFSPISRNLSGTFGPSNVAITMIEADDPVNIDKVWDTGDTLMIKLSRDTDYAGKGPGTSANPWRKVDIDEVFKTGCSPAPCVPVPFGEDYTGRWWDRRRFQITVVRPNLRVINQTLYDLNPNDPNAVEKMGLDGQKCCAQTFQINILASGNLRHYPATSSPASTCGGPNACPAIGVPTSDNWGTPGCVTLGLDLSGVCEKLVGDYGTPFPRFESVVGKGPLNAVSRYVSGSTITITFTEFANLGSCTAKDIADLVTPYSPCSQEIGTCSINLWDVGDFDDPEFDVASYKAACDTENGVFVNASGDSYHNCQLVSVTSKSACEAHQGRGIANWTSGIAPHQSCSDGTKPTLDVCTTANATWRIHQTIVPQQHISLAMDFSDVLGTSFNGQWLDFGPLQNGVCTVPCAKKFQINILNASLSSPPEIDLFKIRLNPNRGIAIRRSYEFSPGSDAPSKGMSGDFGPAVVNIISLKAGANPTPQRSNSRGPLTGLYEEGCTISVEFDRYTNRGNFSMKDIPKGTIDLMFNFSKSLGSQYTGAWTNCTTHPGKTLPGCQSFVITILNASGAGPPTVSGLNITLLETGNIRNYPSASAPASGNGPVISGNFGPSSVYIEQLIASDKENLHSRFDIGDKISLLFNMPTNRADMGLNQYHDKSRVDRMLKFSTELAANYTGVWLDNSTFEISITELDPLAQPPYIGMFTMQLVESGNLRNYPPTSAASDTQSVPLSGGFGLSTVYIVSTVADDPEPKDYLYGDGDTITVTFSQSTNKAGLPDNNVTKEQLNNLFHFSMQLGDAYKGDWLSDSVIKITIINHTKPASYFWCEMKEGCDHPKCDKCALLTEWHTCVRLMSDSTYPDQIINEGSPECPSCPNPQVSESRLRNNGTTDCPYCPSPTFEWMQSGICTYRSDGGYDPPILDVMNISVKEAAQLREIPPILNPSTGLDETGKYPPAYLSGGFGLSKIEIVSLIACDPDSADTVFGDEDVIYISFSEPTNRGNMPETEVSMEQILTLFSFSHGLGNNFVGIWPNRSTFVITIKDSTGNGGPTIDSFYVQTRLQGNLRNFPAISEAAVVSGTKTRDPMTLKGEFGPSAIYIKSFRASSPESRSDVYNVGAAFTIAFSEKTNRGGLSETWTKEEIDNAFAFYSDLYDPHPLGVDYYGQWLDNATFRILITEVDKSEPRGPPPLSGGNFRVSVNFEGNIRNQPPQSAATVINKFVRAAAGIGGSTNPGMDCDCCTPCGDSCDVCNAYACIPFLNEFDVMISQCTNCCGGRTGSHCCRILSGNYGKLVSVYDISPQRVAVTGQVITINGHGFDGRSQYNKVFVGGVNCPVLESKMDEATKDGYLVCKAPDGIGPDVKTVEVDVFDYFTEPPTIERGFCCKLLDSEGFIIMPRDMLARGGKSRIFFLLGENVIHTDCDSIQVSSICLQLSLESPLSPSRIKREWSSQFWATILAAKGSSTVSVDMLARWVQNPQRSTRRLPCLS